MRTQQAIETVVAFHLAKRKDKTIGQLLSLQVFSTWAGAVHVSFLSRRMQGRRTAAAKSWGAQFSGKQALCGATRGMPLGSTTTKPGHLE